MLLHRLPGDKDDGACAGVLNVHALPGGIGAAAGGTPAGRGRGAGRVLLLAGSLAAAHAAQAQLARAGGRRQVVAIGALRDADLAAPAGVVEEAITAAMALHRARIIALAPEKAEAGAMLALGLHLARRHETLLALCAGQAEGDIMTLSCPRPRPGRPGGAQRWLDVGIALIALVALAPLLAAAALAVTLDSPGPVLFRQTRCGWRGRPFRILKFRTMHHDAHTAGALIQTSRGDRRVTGVGRVLRRTSIDELPQLFNVLRGDMALVGPRPHALNMTVAGQSLASLAADYDARHAVRPGITGWAQVNGSRGEVVSAQALRRRLALDLHYVAHRSLLLNLRIMLRTLLVIADRHAY